MPRRSLVTPAALLGLLLLPAAAPATTASVQQGVIVVEDTAGIDDFITTTEAGSGEQGETIRIIGATAGEGCASGSDGALCPDGTGPDGTGTPHSMRITLGGGRDRVNLFRGIDTGVNAPDIILETGAGADRVEATSHGRWLINTGTEGDTVRVLSGGGSTPTAGPASEPATIALGPGDDVLEMPGHASVGDTADGGDGFDHASYARRAQSVTIISDPSQPSGRTGEDDRLSGFEKLQGGNAADTILGGPGRDTLIGGPGTGDVLRGFAASDTLDTNDGVADARADCGADFGFSAAVNDVAIIDSVDPHPNFVFSGGIARPVNGGSRNCETVRQQPRGEKPLALLRAARVSGRAVVVRVRCTRPGGCRGTLRVTKGARKTISATRRLRLARGGSRRLRVPLRVRSVPDRLEIVAEGRDPSGRVLSSSVVVRR